MPKVIAMHFVCRNDLNVIDFGNGIFETGVWAVSAEAARTTLRVALHETRAHLSYRQGSVIDRRMVLHQGRTRFVFRVRDDGVAVPWVGGGTGEKGYAWG